MTDRVAIPVTRASIWAIFQALNDAGDSYRPLNEWITEIAEECDTGTLVLPYADASHLSWAVNRHVRRHSDEPVWSNLRALAVVLRRARVNPEQLV